MKKYLFIIIASFPFVKINAQGHGPLYGLQTPTLAKGGFDFNAAAMSIATENDQSFMIRYVWSYGITEDVQVNITTPTVINRLSIPTGTRGNSNMPANGDIEASIWYRFFSNAFGVGKRIESTAILSASAPTEKNKGQTKVTNSVHAAVSTGYASRTWYAWVGGGYQYYFQKGTDQLGDLPYGSLVVGYRPNLFMGDYPKPDWRIFVESLVEFPGSNKFEGQLTPLAERGKKVMIGPSFLGLYGAWGLSFGALFPAYQDINQNLAKEKYRLSFNISYWL